MDALDLVERDLLVQPVVELGGAGGLVPRDPGRDLEVAAVSQVLGDPGAAEAVGADLGGDASVPRAARPARIGAVCDERPRDCRALLDIAQRREPAPRLHAARTGLDDEGRYAQLYAESPNFNDKAPLDAWLFEPFYQILRLRLLADRMVRDRELGVSEAKVVVVVPQRNRAYRARVTSPWFATAFPNRRTVSDIVRETLVDPDSTYATVSQSTLAGAVREHCAEAVASWSAYHRDRYGW